MQLLSRWMPVSILLALFAVERAMERHEFTQVHMGLSVRLVLYAAEAGHARDAASAAFTRIAELDAKLSDYRPDSELSSLNARAGTWVTVGDSVFDVVRRASTMAQLTGGAFDPSVGPLVALWREARPTGRLPSADALTAARARVGWQHVELDSRRRAIRLRVPGMRLDLGGIAKGYILQEAVGTLAARSISRVLLEAGGDIVAGDPPPGREGWRVDVPDGADIDARFRDRAASLSNAALATSGPAAQFAEVDGVRYSHVIDPRRGIGLTHSLTARVIASDGATADALATALTVAGREDAARILAKFPGAVASISAR